MKTDPKKLFTAKIGKACIDLHARKFSPSYAESVIMGAVMEYEKSIGISIPALKPLKLEVNPDALPALSIDDARKLMADAPITLVKGIPAFPDFRWGENPKSIFIDSEECIVGSWKLSAYADGSWDVGLCKSPDVGEHGQSMVFTLAAAKSEAEAWARENIMLVQAALKPLKWEETRLHQSVLCPNSNGRYSLEGTDDGWHCEFIPAKGITRHQLKENVERGVAIAAIEEHRNSKLKENLQ